MEMTGDEFKKLVEQRDPNELIDTIPEILDFLSGIRQGETLEQYIKRIISSLFILEDDGKTLRIIVPDSYEDYDEIDNIEDLPEDTRSTSVILSKVINEYGNDKPYFRNILVSKAEVDNTATLKALDGITLDGISLAGGKDSSNGKIIFASRYLNLRNIIAKENTTLYNAFEGYQRLNDADYMGIEKITAEKMNIDCPSITHNIINVYTPADGAKIVVKNSKFNLTVDNSNVLRLANYTNAEDVTVTFENCEWTYENGLSHNDWRWAGLAIYQPASADIALGGDLTKLRTWTFNFINCKYNGQKVTGNNFGGHNQVFYLYNVGNTGAVTDPLANGLTLNFE